MDTGNRAESIKFKLMPDGHIRGVQMQRPDKASAAEWMIYPTTACCPTISVAHVPKLLITDLSVFKSLVQHHAIRKRWVIGKCRSEIGRRIRRQYRNDIGVPFSLSKGHTLMLGGYSGAITTFTTDNQIMELLNNNDMDKLTYHEHPTKEQLLEYFSPRIRIRKMSEKEAFRLMDVSDDDIEKIRAYPFRSYAEREAAIAKADKKELARIKRESISKTAQFKLAGNSIVCSVLTYIFESMFLPGQPENRKTITQPSLFD